jgi:hypothetical protein
MERDCWLGTASAAWRIWTSTTVGAADSSTGDVIVMLIVVVVVVVVVVIMVSMSAWVNGRVCDIRK